MPTDCLQYDCLRIRRPRRHRRRGEAPRQPISRTLLLRLRNRAPMHIKSKTTNCKRSARLPVRIMHDGTPSAEVIAQPKTDRTASQTKTIETLYRIGDRRLCSATWMPLLTVNCNVYRKVLQLQIARKLCPSMHMKIHLTRPQVCATYSQS
jgi:hypothetical protein